MTEFIYKPILSVTEKTYLDSSNRNIYDVLGKDLDLTKITLIVEAENEEKSDKIRMAVTDVRMWELVNDLENDGL